MEMHLTEGDAERGGASTHVVQVNDTEVADEISPLLIDMGDNSNRVNIFSVSYLGRRPHKEAQTIVEAEVSFFSQIFMWVWSGSKYSGLLCIIFSSTIYYIMEALMDIFPGLSISYIGVLLAFQPIVLSKETSTAAGDTNDRAFITGQTIFAVLLGLLSSIANGICYCLIKTATKASDHPVYTVFSFGLLVTPLSAICMLAFQKFVLPNIFTLLLMVVLGVLAFFAEVYLARGLQLEKVSKATNMLYIQAIFFLLWSMSYLESSASFKKLIGCLLILLSLCSTMYIGPEREQNDGT